MIDYYFKPIFNSPVQDLMSYLSYKLNKILENKKIFANDLILA